MTNVPHATIQDRRAGVTLVELVIVIVLMGVLSAVAIPVFTGGQELALWKAAQQLEVDLRFAQEWAINHHTDTWVVFLPLTHQYMLLANGGTEAISHPVTLEGYVVDLADDGISLGVLSLSAGSRIEYSSTGEALVWGTIELKVDSLTRDVAVEEETGAIQVQ